jgi:hypothetical protein
MVVWTFLMQGGLLLALVALTVAIGSSTRRYERRHSHSRHRSTFWLTKRGAAEQLGPGGTRHAGGRHAGLAARRRVRRRADVDGAHTDAPRPAGASGPAVEHRRDLGAGWGPIFYVYDISDCDTGDVDWQLLDPAIDRMPVDRAWPQVYGHSD